MYRSTLAAWIVVGLVGCSSFDAKNESAAQSTPDAGDDADAGGPPAVGGTSDLSLEVVAVPGARLVQGATSKVTVTVKRGKGSQDPTKLFISAGLRDGITAATTEVPASATTADLQITVPAVAAQGMLALTVTASTPQRTATAPLQALVRGTPGSVDTTFGTQGIARHLLGPGKNALATDLVVLDDDRLIAVSECVAGACVVRTSADGVADKAYGTGGTGALPMVTLGQAAADPTGRIVLSGNGGANSLKVGRLTAQGQPDASFGSATGVDTGTRQFVPAGGGPPETSRTSLALRKDGTLALGFAHVGAPSSTLGLTVLTTTGATETTFGTAGSTTGRPATDGPPMGVRANGNIWVFAPGPGICYVDQVDAATGAPDPTFAVGNEGHILCGAAPVTSTVGGAATLPDGSLMPAFKDATQVKVAKFVPDGSHTDLAWGAAGLATINEDALPRVSVDKNGLVLVTLARADGLRFVRLGAGGALDPTFGASGTVVHSFGVNHQIARALIQKDGRIVVLGTEDFADGADVTLTRYWD